jgi:D-alanyl-D-alanine endopeptidase (penicillin-binding protein 7)
MPRSSRLGFALLLLCLGSASAFAADARLLERFQRLDPAGLELASVNAAVAELRTDTRLYSKNAHRQVPIASITKLMMALVVLDSGEPLDEWLAVVERHRPAPNNAYSRIRLGSRARRRDLLRIALMASENRAAYVLARHHPGGFTAFIDAMNARAAALGMDRTHFAGPSGLDPANRSTPADLLKLLKASRQYSRIRRYTQTAAWRVQFRGPSYQLVYSNTNVLIYRDRWDVRLSKTGYLNEAGRCLLLLTRIDGLEVAMVLLDSFGRHSPIGDAGRIKRWLRTGTGGPVAAAAAEYEQRERAQYRRAAGSE